MRFQKCYFCLLRNKPYTCYLKAGIAMVTWLRKLFVKDYEKVDRERVRASHGKLAAWFGIITNFLIAGMKLAIAIILASQDNWVFPMALIADSVNNFSDMGTSLVTLVGFKMASKPADKEHPFGHERIEYIAGLIVAMIVVVLAVELFRDSLTKIIDQATTTYDLLAIIILGVSIVLKLFQSYVNRGLGKAINSLPLKATAVDSFPIQSPPPSFSSPLSSPKRWGGTSLMATWV